MTQIPEKPLIEVCVSSVTDAVLAERAGAKRLELCSALELGGLTPSIGTVQACLQAVKIPVVVMIRPRAGGFAYDENELDTMLRDIDALGEAGAAGFVFGVLTEEGDVDCNRLKKLVQQTSEKESVFHRAFDFVRRPSLALEQLIDSGVTRLLTSGGCETALLGADNILRLVEDAKGRIDILPGGGIRPENIDEILKITMCKQAHVGASALALDPSISANNLLLTDPRCMATNRHRRIDPVKIPV